MVASCRDERQTSRLQISDIGFFENHDARVVAQFPIELAIADIHRDDLGGAMDEQTIGKAAGGSADVDGTFAADLNGKLVQRLLQFDAAAADIGRRGFNRDRRRAVDQVTRFSHRLPID